jgi:hypothetical protein
VPHCHLRASLLACLTAAVGAFATPAAAQTDSAAAPPAAAPQVPRERSPWRLGTELAFTDISGNRQLQLFQSTVTVGRQSPQTFNLDLKLEGRYGESNHQEAAKSAAARARLDWTPRALVSPFLGCDAEYDHIRKIDARISGGLGVNLNFVRRESTHATLSVGLLEEYVDYASPTSPGSVSDTRFSTRLAFVHTVRPGVQLEFNARHQPATSRLWDYLLKIDAGLRVALTTKLGWRTAYTWNRDSTPAEGVRPDDRTLTTGLVIQWW